VDSGANVHIVHDQSLLHNPVHYQPPRSLNLATSDARGGIVACGDVCLISHSGIPLWIHNGQCVPAATTKLLSVSAAIVDHQLVGGDSWEGPIREADGL
jgi:hypothetical protein